MEVRIPQISGPRNRKAGEEKANEGIHSVNQKKILSHTFV
jgi:hypothetical protein